MTTTLIFLALTAALTIALIELVLGRDITVGIAARAELQLNDGPSAGQADPGFSRVLGPLPLLFFGLGVPALPAAPAAGLILFGLAVVTFFGPKLAGRATGPDRHTLTRRKPGSVPAGER